MQGFTSFFIQTVAGLTIDLGYTVSDKDQSKTAVFLPALPARVRKTRTGEVKDEVSISRTAFKSVSKSINSLEDMKMDESILDQFSQKQIKAELGTDIAAAIEPGKHYAFVLGVRDMLEAYDEAHSTTSEGVTNPAASLANFICATVPVAEFPTLTAEALSLHIVNYLGDAVAKAQKKANDNGIKPNGLAMMRTAKAETVKA